MKNKTIDVYIYITSKEVQQVSAELLKQLGKVTGVASVNINARLKKLLDISYDPASLSPRTLINEIKKHGHTASLVGM